MCRGTTVAQRIVVDSEMPSTKVDAHDATAESVAESPTLGEGLEAARLYLMTGTERKEKLGKRERGTLKRALANELAQLPAQPPPAAACSVPDSGNHHSKNGRAAEVEREAADLQVRLGETLQTLSSIAVWAAEVLAGAYGGTAGSNILGISIDLAREVGNRALQDELEGIDAAGFLVYDCELKPNARKRLVRRAAEAKERLTCGTSTSRQENAGNGGEK